MIEFIKKHKFNIIWISLAVLLFVIDIVSKQIVLHNMTVGQTIPVIGNFLVIEYVINDGAAFGMQFKDGLINKILWICISIVGAIILIAIYVIKNKKLNNIYKSALMLMTSGCIGNLIDRAFYTSTYLGVSEPKYGGVVDFIGANFGKLGEFPRFNIADSCLVIGTFMLVIYLFIQEAKEIFNKQKSETLETPKKILSKDEIEKESLINQEKTTDETKE
jgi:signal peptidase II